MGTVFAIGVTLGFIGSSFASWLAVRWEWQNRRRLERRVDELYRHFACGGGYIGCNGGPKCTSDHK